MKNNLPKKFKNFLWQEKLFSEKDKIIIGISGGGDSICLTNLLLTVQKKFKLQLHLVHINYHLRGEEADKDEKFIREFAKNRKINLTVIPYFLLQEKGKNLEEELRNFRYQVFEKIRQKKKYDWIAVGHHQDDQVETFLLNLFRGAGPEGLGGMKIKDERNKILRPLLNFNKVEILGYLQNIKQNWREDKSNQDERFLRNKIRQQLIPEIEKEYSPQFKIKVSNTSKQLQEYQAIVQRVVDRKYKKIIIKKNSKNIFIDIVKYKKISAEVQPLVFRKIIKELKGNLRNITATNYQEFQKIIYSQKDKRQKIKFAGIKIENNKKNVVLIFDR